MFIESNTKIYVAGHRGMVGSAIVRFLQREGCNHIITCSRKELDLTNQRMVQDFFQNEKIDFVVLAAAKVGGIYANNTYPADFIYENLVIQANVIHNAYKAGVENLLFLGSSCIYPKFAPQPIKEEYLLTSILESTNEPYAIAKIAGIKMCESYNRQYGTNYRAAMPTNLFGPYDNYHLENSHVLPALIRKFHLAKLAMQGNLEGIKKDEDTYGLIPQDIRQAIGYSAANNRLQTANLGPKVVVWGTGKARREFLHVDDLAAACFHIMSLDSQTFTNAAQTTTDGHQQLSTHSPLQTANNQSQTTFLNVGAGNDISISEVAELVREVVGFEGEIIFDKTKPDGTPQKLMDSSRLNDLGWKPKFTLRQGLEDAYKWYCANLH